MVTDIREWLLAWQMRRWIKAATMAVYSEQFDVDAIVRNIAGNGNNSKLLRAYIAVRVAADTKLHGARPIGRMLEEARYLETEYPNLGDDQTVLALRRAEAAQSLTKAGIEFSMERLAPEFSCTGAVYLAEKNKKGPLSPKERERLKTMTDELAKLDRKIEACQKTQDKDAGGTERPGLKRCASEAQVVEQGRSSAPDTADSAMDEENTDSNDWIAQREREIEQRSLSPLSDTDKQALLEELSSLRFVLDARHAKREAKTEELRLELQEDLRKRNVSAAAQITLPTFREWLAFPENSEVRGTDAEVAYLDELQRRYDEGIAGEAH
jgi:hypothetical protein